MDLHHQQNLCLIAVSKTVAAGRCWRSLTVARQQPLVCGGCDQLLYLLCWWLAVVAVGLKVVDGGILEQDSGLHCDPKNNIIK